MTVTLAELAEALGTEALGDGRLRLRAAAHPAEAGPDDLAVAVDPKYADALAGCAARAALLWPGADWAALGFAGAVLAARPRAAMSAVTRRFDAAPRPAPGIHPAAVIDPSAEIGTGVAIGPFCVVAAGARLGDGAALFEHVSVGAGAEIGAEGLVQAGVRVAYGVRIGPRARVHANAVIGADGFSFVSPEGGALETARGGAEAAVAPAPGAHARIHSLGGVSVGADVEIGAGAAIDRGTLVDTAVGDGTKIDNLVQIGHNVRVGGDCLLCAQVGIAGSAVVGDRVVLGGKVGVADHVRIGDDAVVAGGSLIGTNVPARAVMMGVPAIKRQEWMRQMTALRRLPRLLDKLTG